MVLAIGQLSPYPYRKYEFYPDLSDAFSERKKLEDSFVLEEISKGGFKSTTNCINIDEIG